MNRVGPYRVHNMDPVTASLLAHRARPVSRALQVFRESEPIIRQLQNIERGLPEGPLTQQQQQVVDGVINSLQKVVDTLTNQELTEYIRYIRGLQEERIPFPHDVLEMAITKISRVRAGGRRRSRKTRKSRKGRKVRKTRGRK
jgi:hypothetical protein